MTLGNTTPVRRVKTAAVVVGLTLASPDPRRYPRGVAPCGSAQRIAIDGLQHQTPGIPGTPIHHLANRKNHSQGGRSNQGNTGPSANGDREAGELGSSRSETADWEIPGNAQNDEGSGTNQRLRKEDQPRESRCGVSRCPARGDLAAGKELQHHEIDHGRSPVTRHLRSPFQDESRCATNGSDAQVMELRT